MFHQVVVWLSSTVCQWGYPGIVMLMALESSFLPLPSEVAVRPAAYLAASGKMNVGMVVFSGTLGSLLEALFNFWIAMKFGRPFFERYGRYLLVSRHLLEKADRFFRNYGHGSTFFGRLLTGIRHDISLQARLSGMGIFTFCATTLLGAGLWVLVLAGLGFWFVRAERLVWQDLHWITLFLAAGCTAALFFYQRKWQHRARRAQKLSG